MSMFAGDGSISRSEWDATAAQQQQLQQEWPMSAAAQRRHSAVLQQRPSIAAASTRPVSTSLTIERRFDNGALSPQVGLLADYWICLLQLLLLCWLVLLLLGVLSSVMRVWLGPLALL